MICNDPIWLFFFRWVETATWNKSSHFPFPTLICFRGHRRRDRFKNHLPKEEQPKVPSFATNILPRDVWVTILKRMMCWFHHQNCGKMKPIWRIDLRKGVVETAITAVFWGWGNVCLLDFLWFNENHGCCVNGNFPSFVSSFVEEPESLMIKKEAFLCRTSSWIKNLQVCKWRTWQW